MYLDTAEGSRQWQSLPTANTSPNLKAARQRLITDVYGSAGITLANAGSENENWKPSRRGAQVEMHSTPCRQTPLARRLSTDVTLPSHGRVTASNGHVTVPGRF